MKCYIGIDGGGTKTSFACFDEKGILINSCTLESCHVLQVNRLKSIEILKKGVRNVLENISCEKKDIYICIGLAGYGCNKILRHSIESICMESFRGYQYILCNDAEIALSGALNGEDGILVVAGTGTMAISKNKGLVKRCGGWGYTIGDEGSAYWIAKRLLQEYTKQCDGRKKRSVLVDYVKKVCCLEDDYDIIPFISQTLENKRENIANLAKIVYDLAEMEDETAVQIYREASEQIAILINTLAKEFSSICTVSYVGSVWNAKKYMFKPLYEFLSTNAVLYPPKNNALYGAYLIAKENFV